VSRPSLYIYLPLIIKDKLTHNFYVVVNSGAKWVEMVIGWIKDEDKSR
jgi:hypothetical protein